MSQGHYWEQCREWGERESEDEPAPKKGEQPLYLSTTAPARTPNKAIGRKPANDARERREDNTVVRAICQMRPIWRIELVNVDTSSPPHTKQILNCHERHSETDLRREVSNIMVMSNRGMACKTARRHNSAAFRRSSTCGKTNHDTPPSLTQFGKPRNFKEAEARLSRIACRQGQSFLAIRSLLYLWLHR